jgi:hypothetical protein
MKTNWIRTLILSAAALTMGSTAYAQSRLVAEIPFSFRVNGTELPAGSYSVERPMNTARDVVQLSNGRNIKVVFGFTAHADKQAPARLIFSCDAGTGCALVQVWDSHGAGLEFRKAKMTSSEKERLAVVLLRRSEAD